MNLSIIHYDQEKKLHILRLKRGLLAGRELGVKIMSCESPVCHCRDIHFNCFPLADGRPPPDESRIYRFSLDVSKWKVTPGQKLDRDSRYLAKKLAAELEDDDWHKLYAHFVSLKREQLRKADIEKLDVEFPPDLLDDPSRMVPYSVIFPFEDHFPFLIENRHWMIDYQFCVNPECDCRESHITFIPIPASPGPQRRIKETLPSAFYHYNTGRCRIDDPPDENQPAVDKLISDLKEAYPDINAILRERHKLLRRLYKKAAGDIHRLPAIIADRIGRNDPCPCGSGKKYKKCCGR